jgi:cold shock CspA family protein
MAETWNKKEKEKKKQQKKKDKAERKLERKENNKDNNNFEYMLAYLDENGNLSSKPPDPNKKRVLVNAEDIEIGVPKQKPVNPEDLIRQGIVSFFNDAKGYGFIKDLVTQESVFVHINSLSEPIKENNKVSFEIEMGPKGAIASNVKLVK